MTLGIWRETLVTSYDPEYKATKLVKQGKAALEPMMAGLAEWVASRWHVTVLNIIYDHIDVARKIRPRLQVIVEHSHERQEFFDGHNFDPLKQQAIAARFAELAKGQGPARYDVDGLLVVFSAFAPLAREEADNQISEAEVTALQERIANPQLWTIHRCFGRVTFMFYTNEQAQSHAEAGFREIYADRYFEILQKHDEFHYCQRMRFSVEFDSKESFEKNYSLAAGSTTTDEADKCQMPNIRLQPTAAGDHEPPRLKRKTIARPMVEPPMTNAPQDEDRTEWDRVWGNRPLRRLVTPVRIDVQPAPEWGERTGVQIVTDPPEFANRIYRKTETCPVCGGFTSEGQRMAVTLHPKFSNGLSIGIGAWAHVKCFAACEEVPGPARFLGDVSGRM